jgi:hypothetical protein
MRHLPIFLLLFGLVLVNQVNAEEIHVSHCRLSASGEFGTLGAGQGDLVITGNHVNVNELLDNYGDENTAQVPLPQNWKAQGSDHHVGTSTDTEDYNDEEAFIAYGFEINKEAHSLVIARTRHNDLHRIEKLSCHIDDPDRALRLLTRKH